jgi:hypothetical protein
MGALALAASIVALAPESAGAVTLGSRNLSVDPEFGTGCDLPDTDCILLQTKLPGTKVRAPFSGKIRKWRIVTPTITEYQLVVMRKRKNGRFKAVGASLAEETVGAGRYTFETNVRIKKGDYIGILGDSFQGINRPRARYGRFVPPPALGDAAKPVSKGSDELLYNATLKR